MLSEELLTKKEDKNNQYKIGDRGFTEIHFFTSLLQ